jgi:hypothetical protein
MAPSPRVQALMLVQMTQRQAIRPTLQEARDAYLRVGAPIPRNLRLPRRVSFTQAGVILVGMCGVAWAALGVSHGIFGEIARLVLS